MIYLLKENLLELRIIVKSIYIIIILSSTIFFGIANPAFAMEGQSPSTQTVVHAVLFFSPNCGHCHKVIEEDLPPIVEKYGEQLVILMIDVTTLEGRQLFQSAAEYFKDQRDIGGVPTLVIGEQVLIGSVEIPAQFPDIIDSGLNSGGIGWPPVPGLGDTLETYQSTEIETQEAMPGSPAETQISEIAATPVPVSQTSAGGSLNPLSSADNTAEVPLFIQRFLQDPIGNSIAVVTLIGMLVSIIVVGFYFVRIPEDNYQSLPKALSWPNWAIPVLCLAGIGVAGYMSYVEITHVEAICGPLGDCNSVQQSPYATLLGFLPVGILGIIGYFAIGAAWLLYRYGPANGRNLFTLGMWGMALLGTLFSIYLTFLEPFVIGATCAWCITSAVLITLLLWSTTGPAIQTLSQNAIEE